MFIIAVVIIIIIIAGAFSTFNYLRSGEETRIYDLADEIDFKTNRRESQVLAENPLSLFFLPWIRL